MSNASFAMGRDDLRSANPFDHKAIYLMEGGRSGWFVWEHGIPVAQHQEDTLEGVFVAPFSARSGSWVRALTTIEYIDPAFFGAVGDGLVDDTIAVSEAIRYSATLKRKLIGRRNEGRVYGVNGQISLPSGAHVEDFVLKQLNPGASGSVKTLVSDSASNLRLVRVVVDRNGNGTNGGAAQPPNGRLNYAFGMEFVSGDFNHFEDCEVYGWDSGTGIKFENQNETTRIIRPYVHDVRVVISSTPIENVDDMFQGIWISNCKNLVVDKAQVYNFGTDNGGSFSHHHNRGIALSGCDRVVVREPYGRRVDQMVDLTGSAGNVDCHVETPRGLEITTNFIKMANSAVRCTCTNGRVANVGLYGYLASGPSEAGLTRKTTDCKFIDCSAVGVGWDNHWKPRGQNPSGFCCEAQPEDPSYPQGTQFIRPHCEGTAYSSYGALQKDHTYQVGARLNEVIDSVFEGGTPGGTSGF